MSVLDRVLAKVSTSPGAIENQQLLLDEYGLGHHGTRPARTCEPGKGRQEVENQDGQVAHGIMLTSQRNRKKCEQIGDSPCTRAHRGQRRQRRSIAILKNAPARFGPGEPRTSFTGLILATVSRIRPDGVSGRHTGVLLAAARHVNRHNHEPAFGLPERMRRVLRNEGVVAFGDSL